MAGQHESVATGGEDQAALLQKLQRWYCQDLQMIADWRREAREDFAFYNGDQWAEADRALLLRQQRPLMTFNRVAPLVNAVIGAEINNRREVRYIPREMGDLAANELLTNAGEWFRDQANAEDEDSDAFEDTVICGMGWTDTGLDFSRDPDGAPSVRRLDPLKMVWDASAVKANLEDAQHLFYVEEKPLAQWRDMFPDAGAEALHAGWAKHGQMGEFSDPPVAAGEDERLCTIVEARWLEQEIYYRGSDPVTGRMRDYSRAEGEALYDEGVKLLRQSRRVVRRAFLGATLLGAVDQPLAPAGQFGWECITGYRDKLSRQFYGVVRAAKDPQRWSNKFFSQVMFLLNSQAKGGIMAERGAFEDERDAELSWARADSITWLKNGGSQRILPKPVAQFPTGFFALFNEAREAINQVTGLSAEFIGTRAVDQAGVLEAQRRQSSLNLLASLFNSLRRYRKRQGRILLHLIQNHLSDGRLIRIVGEDKARYVPLLSQSLFADHCQHLLRQMLNEGVPLAQAQLKIALATAHYRPADGEFDIIIDDAPNSPNEKERNWAILQQILPLFKELLSPEMLLDIARYTPLPATLVEQWANKAEQARKAAADNAAPVDAASDPAMQLQMQKMQMELAGREAEQQMRQQGQWLDLNLKRQKAELELAIARHKVGLAALRG